MTEDPNRGEPVRLTASTRAAAMWLAFLAVVLGGVLLLTLWSTRLAADRFWGWRLGAVATAAIGFLILTWAIITAFGVFTHASASPADPGFLSVRPPPLVMRRKSRSGSDLEELLYRTALSLGAAETFKGRKPGQSKARQAEGAISAGTAHSPPTAALEKVKAPRKRRLTGPPTRRRKPDFELNFELVPGRVILAPAGASLLDVGQDAPRDNGNGPERKSLALPSAAASGLLVPRNQWIARVWLRAAGERVAVGALATIVAVLLLASGRIAQPSSGENGSASGSSSSRTGGSGASSSGTGGSASPSHSTGGSASSSGAGKSAPPSNNTGGSASSSGAGKSAPPSNNTGGSASSSSGTVGSAPSAGGSLGQALVGNVVAGVAPVLADTLAPALGSLATQAADAAGTPDELQKKLLDLAVNDVAAPFLHAGSETLGDAVGDALAGKVGLKQKPSAPPSKKAVAQVKTALQKKLAAELASMRSLTVIADYVGLSPSELAYKIAGTIAQHQASGLAAGLGRLPQSGRLDDPSLILFIEQVVKRLVPRQLPQPPPTVAYTVQPGDSLWGISQQLLGPTAASREIAHTWQLIYRDNHTTVGTNPNQLVPGQVLHVPSTRESALSQGWVLLPWPVVAPGTLTGIAIRRRRRSQPVKKRRPAAQAEVKAPIASSAPEDDSQVR